MPSLIARLSAVCALLPGDIIFTGTPSGVGAGRKLPRYLTLEDELTSWIENTGDVRTVHRWHHHPGMKRR